MLAQLIDATPCNQLIRQCFSIENRSAGLVFIGPIQGSVLFDLTRANGFGVLGCRTWSRTGVAFIHRDCPEKRTDTGLLSWALDSLCFNFQQCLILPEVS